MSRYLRLIRDPENPLAALLAGTIPQAQRGIIFIEEINRLADTAPEVAAVVLPAMGTRPGQVQMAEPGLPGVTLPIAVTIWAKAKPAEAAGPHSPVGKPLADRFDLTVAMGQPDNYQAVADIPAGSSAQPVIAALPGKADNTLNARLTSCWVLLWATVKRQLAAVMRTRCHLPAPQGGGEAGAAARIVDPLATTIIAPPKPAIPLASLPDDQLVTRDNRTHV